MSHDQQLRLFVSPLIVLGLCGFLTSFAISFQSLGLGQGLKIGDAEVEQIQHGRGKNPFGYTVQNTHQRMASDYGAISAFFLLIAVTAAVQILFGNLKQILPPLVSMASAAVVANFLRILIQDKHGVEESFYEAPRNTIVKLTLAYDWFFLILVAAVVLNSLFLIIRAVRTKTT